LNAETEVDVVPEGLVEAEEAEVEEEDGEFDEDDDDGVDDSEGDQLLRKGLERWFREPRGGGNVNMGGSILARLLVLN